jgi:type I restriction enzyme S subunit
LSSIELSLPSKYEQRAIAHVLGTLDDKIDLNRRMSKTLETMVMALFKSWFVDFEPVRAKMEGRWRRGESLPGLPAHLYDLFPSRLVNSELGEIPEGWRVATLGEVAEHPRRVVQPESILPNTPYIALEHMPRRSIALSEWGTGDGLESNKFRFKKGEILFGKLRPYFHKVGIAPVDGVCSTNIVVVTPRWPAWFGFVLGHVSSVEFVKYTDAGSTGTIMPQTSWADMGRYEIVLPSQLVAETFTTLVRPWTERIIAGIHESRTLAALRDTMLPKLVSGELCIKGAEMFVEVAA